METSENFENELLKLINEAYKANTPKSLHQILPMIYEKFNFRKCFLKKVDIEKLNKLAHQAEALETHFSVGVIYNIILSYKLITIEAIESDCLLVIVNILYPLFQELQGTILSKRLIVHIRHILHLLNRRPEITKEDLQEIKNMLESPNIKHQKLFFEYNELSEVKDAKECFQNLSGSHRISGIMKLIQVFEKCSSIEEQLEIFSKKLQPLLKQALTDLNEKSIEILKVAGVMLDHLFYETEFLVRLKKEVFNPQSNIVEDMDLFMHFQKNSESSKDQIVTDDYLKSDDMDIFCYKASEPEITIKSCENVYHIVAFIINNFIMYKSYIDIQRICLRVLRRFFTYFPNFNKQLEEPIMKVMSNIHEDTNPNNKKEAAAFLYRLIHRDASPEFKEKLETKGNFPSLFESSAYCEAVLKKTDNMYESLALQDLYIKTGFPSNITIEAGSSFTVNVEIWKPYSIIYWAFLLSSHDVDFSLYRMSSFESMIKGDPIEPIELHAAQKIETQKNVWTKGTFIVKEPGLYRIEFSNKNSWFNSKNLRYTVVVLEPDFKIDEYVPKSLRKKSVEHTGPSIKKPEEQKTEVGVGTMPKAEHTLRGKGIIHLASNSLQFFGTAHGTSAELELPYSMENIDWKTINSQLIAHIQKIIEPGKHSAENQLSLHIIYNPHVYRTLFKIEGQESQQGPKDNLIDAFSPLLNLLHSNLSGPVSVDKEVDFALNKHAQDPHLTYRDNIYFLFIDDENQKFVSKFRKSNQMVRAMDLNLLVAPVISDSEAKVEGLISAYFKASSESVKNSILATILINICVKHENELTAIEVYQKDGDKYISEDTIHTVKNLVESNLINREDDRIFRVPTINLKSVKINEFVRS